jgi:two-component system, NarL family, sensor histidine kinase DegS
VASSQRDQPAEATDQAEHLAVRLAGDLAALDKELAEIEMLVNQAQTEASRHEQRRSQTADKLATSTNLPAADLATLNSQLVSLTKRAAVMEAQVEVLEGKRKTLSRYRDSLLELAERFGGLEATGGGFDRTGSEDGAEGGGPPRLGSGDAGTGMSRIVLNAQEDLRREIARAMHDGPAQSLTNIVLQAQILERLLGRDPDAARGELRLLVQMVQQTLDATKTFIFDVRPMVLDDLGLVPTLRRAARERGRRAGTPIEFDSVGQDRRLEVDLESALFRIVDEALAGYLTARPDRISISIDWSDEAVSIVVEAQRAPSSAVTQADAEVAEAIKAADSADKDLPPALESMLTDRRERAESALASARAASVAALPAATWREIQQRAQTVGISAVLTEAGARIELRAETPVPAEGGEDGGS